MIKRVISPMCFYVLIISLIIWLIGFVGFCLYALSFKFQSAEHSDAIVVLTGGSERISTALDLLKDEYAEYLLISGVHPSVKIEDLTKGLSMDVRQKITLDYNALDTRGNARETVHWMARKKAESVLLITSFYHMPRAIFEVLKLNADIRIKPLPVFPKSFNDSVEWIRTRYAWLLFVEYHKFLATHLQHFFERTIP